MSDEQQNHIDEELAKVSKLLETDLEIQKIVLDAMRTAFNLGLAYGEDKLTERRVGVHLGLEAKKAETLLMTLFRER